MPTSLMTKSQKHADKNRKRAKHADKNQKRAKHADKNQKRAKHADKNQKRAKHAEMTQSEQVLCRKRDGAALAAGIRSFSEAGARALEERLQPVLRDGEEMPDIGFLFELLGRLVQKERQHLDQADEDRWIEGMELLTLRQETRQAKDELHAEAITVRKTLVDLYGSARCRFQFGLSKRTPRGAEDLELETGRLVRRLASPSLVLPQTDVPGITATPRAWVATLRPKHERLAHLLAEIEKRRVGKSDQVLRKNRALERFDQTYLLVARSVEALLSLAGETELSQRLRATARARVKRGRRRRRANQIVRVLHKPAGVVSSNVVRIAEWLRSQTPRRLLKAFLPEFRKSAVSQVSPGLEMAPNL